MRGAVALGEHWGGNGMGRGEKGKGGKREEGRARVVRKGRDGAMAKGVLCKLSIYMEFCSSNG